MLPGMSPMLLRLRSSQPKSCSSSVPGHLHFMLAADLPMNPFGLKPLFKKALTMCLSCCNKETMSGFHFCNKSLSKCSG